MSDSIVALVIAYFGMLAFFAWLLILVGGIWWYRSTFVSFVPCIDFPILWRPLTPSIKPKHVVEKITKKLDKEVVCKTEKFNHNETLKSLHSLEKDLKQFEKNSVLEDTSSKKIFNQNVENSFQEVIPVFSEEYYENLKKTIISEIQKFKTELKGIVYTQHPFLLPHKIFEEIKKSCEEFEISNCEAVSKVEHKYNYTYYVYVVNQMLSNIIEIVEKAHKSEYSTIIFENFDREIRPFIKQLNTLKNVFKPELGLDSSDTPIVILKIATHDKVIKVDYSKLCDKQYCLSLFKINNNDGVEEQKTNNEA
jgi:hypothetical protein